MTVVEDYSDGIRFCSSEKGEKSLVFVIRDCARMNRIEGIARDLDVHFMWLKLERKFRQRVKVSRKDIAVFKDPNLGSLLSFHHV